ncbi:hypothetical protein D5S18_07295 [Nocardia panacis]|uniref:RelA/SpoT domain-containing protein n=1 Tax=Nocardia panacis TaxID=2340916 RepID=A0A3A4KF33_9NOCA|nr:RelA/SpoT domain-containing protein [Nocardia panacis]RJO77549.1 hypothetical protein D5S18_07295 [Nocardia panacis]
MARHPVLARLLSDHPDLEHSCRELPRKLNSLMRHPEAVRILAAAVRTVAERGAEAVLADPVRGMATPLTPEQRAISRQVRDRVRQIRPRDRLQPGFDASRHHDGAYQREFLDRQYAAWPETQRALNELAGEIAGQTGGAAHWRTQPKDRERAWEKIGEYRGDVSRLVDLVGARIVFDRVDEVYRALACIADDTRVEIVYIKDRFDCPQASGYRDVLLNLRMPNGHIAELCLHLRRIEAVVRYEHALYEVQRDFETLARRENRELSPREAALNIEVRRYLNGLFWQATVLGLPDGPADSDGSSKVGS